MTKYLNYKLENLLVNEIEGYISNCIDNQYIKYSEKIDADDDDADEVIDDLIHKMFNDFQDGLNFGEYIGDNNDLQTNTIKLIQYCNNYYENVYGTENLIECLNWRDFDNFEIIINNAAYVFVNDNRKVFMELWNKIIDDAGEYNVLK